MNTGQKRRNKCSGSISGRTSFCQPNTRRDFLQLACAAMLGLPGILRAESLQPGNSYNKSVSRSSDNGQDKPNILVILTDDQGCGDYSAFGTTDIRTPNIDRLFHEGMTFQNFYANSCVCSPSRAALLTGCFPDRVGVPGVIREENPDQSEGWLSPKATLLPQVLKPAGYHTAIIGKWHLGLSSPNTPTARGFDFYHGFLGDMMDDYWTHLRHGYNFMRRNMDIIDPRGHATDVFTDWACEYLDERAKVKQPFFLYLAYNAPHDPIQPPPEWLEKVKQREPGILETRAKLVALIEHLDAGIGKVLNTLDRTGLAKNTLVIFTSDNGGNLMFGANNGPWRSGKGHMYEGGLRVAGAARWPDRIQPGSVTGRITLTMDIFPTVCDVAGIKSPADIDGVSFLPAFKGQNESTSEREYYFVRREGGVMYGGKTIEALRQGDWKLLQDSPFAPLELYNLRNDPKEVTDLGKKEMKVLRAMNAALRLHIQRGGSVPWQSPDVGRGLGIKR
ncbi:MAG: sulfatase-like hydrolase/transferase [Kiritimatiellae bacterium]|nr:sulfatase-like hydrolase/transferase [Kiritimatiellia bacterium]